MRLLSVSFDPENDTPPCSSRTRRRSAPTPPSGIRDPSDRRDQRASPRSSASRPNRATKVPAIITHNLRTAVIDADGKLVKIRTGQHLDAGRTHCRPQSGSRSRPLTRRRRRLCLHRGRAAVIARLRTPLAVQRWLNALPYNTETGGETLRSFRGVVARRHRALPRGGALGRRRSSSSIGYPPLVLSFESIDLLDHVIFVYRTAHRLGIGGALARPGTARPQAGVRHAARARAQLLRAVHRLHRPRQSVRRGRSARARALRLAVVGKNVWKVEQLLLDWPHRPIASSKARGAAMRAPLPRVPRGARLQAVEFYRGASAGLPLPAEFDERG